MQEPAFAAWRFRKLNYASKSEEEVQEAELVEVEKPGIERLRRNKGLYHMFRERLEGVLRTTLHPLLIFLKHIFILYIYYCQL